MKKKIKNFPDFIDKNILTPFKHDVHGHVFSMMYKFLNYYCTRYIKTCIHQRLNPRPDRNTLRAEPPNQFNILLLKMTKFNFMMFDMKLFKRFKL